MPAGLLVALSLSNPGSSGAAPALEAVTSGGWTLAPYDGPALRPWLGWSTGTLTLGLAPALSTSVDRLDAADGQQSTLRVLQWNALAHGWWTPGVGVVGLDLSVSHGRATLDEREVGTAAPELTVAPTGGLRAEIGSHFTAIGRGTVPIALREKHTLVGVGGALDLVWTP